MNLLILDVETTGLNPATEKTIEIAAILYNVEHREMLQCLSTLLPCDSNPVEHINHIKTEWTKEKYDYAAFIGGLEIMAKCGDAFVAHNASFDKGFIDALLNHPEFEAHSAHWNSKKLPWICTKNDFKWPSRPSRLRLQDICQSYGIPYIGAHRALSDCQLLMKCLSKVDNLQGMIQKILEKK